MKKIICAVIMAAAVFALAGCKKTNKKADGDAVAALKSRGVFVLGLDDSFPPMGFRDENNEIVGFDIDLAKEVAARLEQEKNILVHPYGNPLLEDYIRVSVGSRNAMQKFLDAFFEIDA